MLRRWTDEQIIEAMRDWEAIFGSPPTFDDWSIGWGGEYPSTSTVRSHFGSWSAALNAAFPPKPTRRVWTRETLVEALQEFQAEHGRPPTQIELAAENGMPSDSTLRFHFGSPAKAYRAAGLVPRPTGVNTRAVAKYLPIRRDDDEH